jgi:diguanylate cyclase (GGDEF)-like protein
MPMHPRLPQPLRQLLERHALVLTLVTALLVSFCFALFGMLPMASQIARAQFDSAIVQVDAGLSTTFQPPTRVLMMSEAWIAGRAPDLSSPDAFNAQFKPILQEIGQVTSVVAGSSGGQGWLLLKQERNQWRNRMTDIPRWGLNKHWLLDQGADGVVQRSWSEQTYDPRQRPWFKGAMAQSGQNSIFWTAPYTFFTTGDAGITVSRRLRLQDGQDFVLGFDLKLRDLSKVTVGASVGVNGLALVFTDDERVLAMPASPHPTDQADWLKGVLKPVAELGVPAVTDALAHWRGRDRPLGEVLSYSTGGAPWLLSVRPHLLGEQRLWVMVLAPRADFVPAWQPVALALVLALLLVMVLTLWMIRVGTLRLSKPLEALADASRRMGQLDFQDTVDTNSPVLEIAELACSQAGMRNTLRSNQQELAARAQALNQQVAVLRDIETRLHSQNDQLSAILENFPGGVLVVDASMRITAFNARYQNMMALPDSLLSCDGLKFDDVLHYIAQRGDFGAGHAEQTVQDRLRQVRLPVPHRFERVLANGQTVEVLGTPLPQGGFVMLYLDVTSERQHQEQLERLAHFDALTGLPNRVLFADRLRQGMLQVSRRGDQLAVAYLDLDGFKFVNDSYGHEVGDQLLLVLAARMKQALREGDTLARLGGDEFVAVLLGAQGPPDGVTLLRRLLAAVDTPVTLLGRELRISVSIGVATYPQSQDVDAEQLLRQADQAMYQAKQAGKNRFHFFDAEHDHSLRGQFESLQRMRQALDRGEFVLYYQPKVNMRSGAVVGAEALIRWQHPDRGLLAPAEFLPLMEDQPLAVDVGRWVIDTALAQVSAWKAAGLAMPVSVNVGARQLQQAGFVDDLRASLARYPQVAPSDLMIEVLETSALEDMARVTGVMVQSRAIGVKYSLDDFGTGYSSLTYLKRLPVSQLKIDRSFVRDMLDDPDDLSILVGVLDMSASFHRQVIAEGVETAQHGLMLLRLGCELAQGYGIARPMPAKDLPGWADLWQADPLWRDVAVVSRQDMPLLFAGAEHRAWVQALEAYLQGNGDNRAQMDSAQCHVGQWLGGKVVLPGTDPQTLRRLIVQHESIHDFGKHLCAMHQQQQAHAALQQLPQLRQMRDELLRLFESLLP